MKILYTWAKELFGSLYRRNATTYKKLTKD